MLTPHQFWFCLCIHLCIYVFVFVVAEQYRGNCKKLWMKRCWYADSTPDLDSGWHEAFFAPQPSEPCWSVHLFPFPPSPTRLESNPTFCVLFFLFRLEITPNENIFCHLKCQHLTQHLALIIVFRQTDWLTCSLKLDVSHPTTRIPNSSSSVHHKNRHMAISWEPRVSGTTDV